MKIIHNPRCQKSRQTLALLEENGVTPDIVLYLKDHLTKDELKKVLKKLKMKAKDIVRKGEKIYKEMYKGQDLTEDQWIDAMIEHPSLIERPIVIKGHKAVIGRPPENVLDLL